MRVQIQRSGNGWRWYVCDDEGTYAMSVREYATARWASRAFGLWREQVFAADPYVVHWAETPLFDGVAGRTVSG